jgi:DtxR family Mn-dependent transcriptional regulator
MLSETGREYLETIYNITVEGDTVVNARLAEKFGVSPPSVTEMLHRLVRDGYVTLDRTRGPRLTPVGVAEAEASLRRHRLAERFLFDILKMDWIAAHEEAHALQASLTPAIEARMVATLGNPTTCPHGNPIPGSAPATLDYLRAHQATRLSNAAPDTPLGVLCISEVVEDETGLLSAVGEKGIRPGVTLVARSSPGQAADTVLVEVNGHPTSIPRSIAEKIWVTTQE